MQRKLSEYQVGLLPPAEAQRVQQHLQQCLSCRRELAALERTVELLHRMPSVDAPPQVWGVISHRMASRRCPAHRVNWVPALAAAMIILVIAGAILVPYMQGQLPQPGAAEGFTQVQLVASWNNPLADRAALGLALLATSDEDPALEALD